MNRAQKVGLWVFGICSTLLLSFFLAPLSVETGGVPPLSGRANAIDYQYVEGFGSWGNSNHSGEIGHNQNEHGLFAWSDLNPFAALIYAFGDLNCHQKYERSWTINDNQLPVCARDIGIFLGLAIGGWWFHRKGNNRWTVTDSFLSVIPESSLESLYRKGHRKIAAFSIAAFGILPTGIDGFTQLLTSYESTNPVRLMTGSTLGIFLAFLFCAMLSARPGEFDGRPEDVHLPGGARLIRKEEE